MEAGGNVKTRGSAAYQSENSRHVQEQARMSGANSAGVHEQVPHRVRRFSLYEEACGEDEPRLLAIDANRRLNVRALGVCSRSRR